MSGLGKNTVYRGPFRHVLPELDLSMADERWDLLERHRELRRSTSFFILNKILSQSVLLRKD
jgi:hypothetical protein